MLRSGLALAALLLAAPATADEAALADSATIPGTATKFKIDGFVQVYGAYFHDQNLYDNGTLIGGEADPLNPGSTPDKQFSMTARTSRIGLATVTPSASLGDVYTRFELDFAQGRGFSGKPHLRQAYLSFGNWLAGHATSNWSDPDAGAATVDFNGPVGQACNDTSYFTQLRYTFPLSRNSRLALSLEKNIASHGEFPAGTEVAPALDATRPDTRYPSLVAAWSYARDWGHLAVRGLEQHYGAYTPAAGGVAQQRVGRWAGALQLSGSRKFGEDTLAGSFYTGQALGPYGIGIQAAVCDLAGHRVALTRNSGWQVGYTHTWNPRLRSNLVASGVHFKRDATNPASIKNAHSYFLNTFARLSPSVELGLEYGFEDLRTFGNAVTRRDGTLTDRNHSSKLQASLTARF